MRTATHPALAREQATEVGMAMEELCRAMPPRAGACVSACSRFRKGWQQSFWGPHSPRLAALKRQYDPECLFAVHRGVDGADWGQGPG